jgi:hypothetical protein
MTLPLSYPSSPHQKHLQINHHHARVSVVWIWNQRGGSTQGGNTQEEENPVNKNNSTSTDVQQQRSISTATAVEFVEGW